MGDMIVLEGIGKRYSAGGSEFPVLEGVDLRVSRGEFVAVIGSSGSGKTTLMNIVGCLDTPSEGRYALDGVDITSLHGDELSRVRNIKIGFIFQGFNLLGKLTALENVELPLVYRGLPAQDRRERAENALESVGLCDRMKHKPGQLSGGQQQRVAIARALASRPSLILADEPTGSLDTRAGNEVISLLARMNSSGTTIMMITHDPAIASRAVRQVRIVDGKCL